MQWVWMRGEADTLTHAPNLMTDSLTMDDLRTAFHVLGTVIVALSGAIVYLFFLGWKCNEDRRALSRRVGKLERFACFRVKHCHDRESEEPFEDELRIWSGWHSIEILWRKHA